VHARRALVLLQPPSAIPIMDTVCWLAARPLDFHLHVRADQPDDIERVARILSDRAVGLVLAGGASRGIAHIGVYQALQEAGVPVDWIVGTSVGAILGATMATGWSMPQIVANNRAAFVGTGIFGDYTLPLISIIRGRRIERQLHRFLDFQIEDLPIPFFCPSCNLGTGAMNVHESGSLAAALRASAALPGVLPPAVHEHQLAIDGMVLNNLPVDLMQRKPVGRIIAVDLSQVRSQQVDYPSVPSPWAVLRSRLLPFTGKVRAPNLMTLMLRATELGTLTRVRELGARADLLLAPPVRQFGMMEVASFDRIVAAGHEYAKVEIAAWLARQEAAAVRQDG
jgi:predicted acylesterase/phospholipase RssA